MCGIVGTAKLLAELCKVGLGEVSHVLDLVGKVVVQDFVAERVYLPGEGFGNVEVEISGGKLGYTNPFKEG